MTHDEEAKLIDAYKARAVEILEDNTYNRNLFDISVNKYGSIQMTQEGAFVECLIWISRDELNV